MISGQCLVCGSNKDITIHHMRDIHSITNKKRPNVRGVVLLCRDCHNVVEDVVNKFKSKRLWFHQGYEQGFKDGKSQKEFEK